jgi:hypothetical protein
LSTTNPVTPKASRLLSSEMWLHVVWYTFTDVSEQRTLSSSGSYCQDSEQILPKITYFGNF